MSGETTITVKTARGHGPNGTMPHERLWCEVSIGGAAAETAQKAYTDAKPIWDEKLQLPSEAFGGIVDVKVLGSMPGHEHIDTVGAGSFHIKEVPKDGQEHPITVPISAGGRACGEVDLIVQLAS